jgi:hypothetical protein
MSFAFRDEPARVLHALLGLAGVPHVFELSEDAEHRVTLRRPRAQPGYALPDFTTRASSAIRVTATWVAPTETLRLDGHFADLATALPARPGPRFAIQSPAFVMPLPGWEALFRRLSAARAPLDATFAQVRLHHVNGKSQIEIAFDPPRY